MGGSKLMLGLVVALLASSAAAAMAGKAYLDTRDRLAVERVQSAALERELAQQIRLAKAAEKARADLQIEVASLEAQGKEIVTEIQTKWRDRVVRESYPVAVECSGVTLPPDVISLLKQARNSLPEPAG